MGAGNVVLLNGTSSAGKSSIARALQEIMADPYLHTGIDHFLPRLPQRCFAVSDGVELATTERFLLVYRGGTGRTVGERSEGVDVHGDGTLVEVRIGPGGVHLLAGMYRGVAAMAAAGIDAIVDDVIHDPRVLAAAVTALRETATLFVGVRLPREVAERRERERGDRGPGGAAAFYDKVHAHGVYDLEVDTGRDDPMTCARQIKAALEDGRPRLAVRALAARFAG